MHYRFRGFLCVLPKSRTQLRQLILLVLSQNTVVADQDHLLQPMFNQILRLEVSKVLGSKEDVGPRNCIASLSMPCRALEVLKVYFLI